MKRKNLYECIARARRAYQDQIAATETCDDLVDAEINLLGADGRLTPDEKKIFKKIAKALAANKADSVKSEAKSLAAMAHKLFELSPAEAALMDFEESTGASIEVVTGEEVDA